jgi:cob(I)alamin adenosyltransferase
MSLPQPRKSKIYTKTGDDGTSSLYNGTRVEKDNHIFSILGDTDELNANIGLAREYCIFEANGLEKYLEEIQSRLLDIGSHIATPLSASSPTKISRTDFDECHIELLEYWIDLEDAKLPKLVNFILPSGGLASSALHVCRCVARRLERNVFGLIREGECSRIVGKYINRLSDFLFVLARVASAKVGCEETIYKKSMVKSQTK